MISKRRRTNPFYLLLVLAGTAFAVTASAYGVMAVKELHASQSPLSASQATDAFAEAGAPRAAPVDALRTDASFVQFMDRHGARMMLTELCVLGIATFAAIGTDAWWTRES